MKKKIYLSGPITGVLEYRRKFNWVEEKFSDHHEVVNPVKIGDTLEKKCRDAGMSEPKWEDYMRECIRQLIDCNIIVLLEGWENSRGAKLEKKIAEELGMIHWFVYETQGVKNGKCEN